MASANVLLELLDKIQLVKTYPEARTIAYNAGRVFDRLSDSDKRRSRHLLSSINDVRDSLAHLSPGSNGHSSYQRSNYIREFENNRSFRNDARPTNDRKIRG